MATQETLRPGTEALVAAFHAMTGYCTPFYDSPDKFDWEALMANVAEQRLAGTPRGKIPVDLQPDWSQAVALAAAHAEAKLKLPDLPELHWQNFKGSPYNPTNHRLLKALRAEKAEAEAKLAKEAAKKPPLKPDVPSVAQVNRAQRRAQRQRVGDTTSPFAGLASLKAAMETSGANV